MADGSLIFDTKLDESGFKKGLDRLQSIGGKAFKAIGTAITATSAAVGAMGVAATKVGMDFEKSMSRVAALSGATEKEFKALEKTALELGKSTVFSSSQAAEAMQYLAMAGFSVNETIAAMPGLLNIAAAGQTDLGVAADITSNILSGFGLAAEEAGRAADVLTKAFTSSNTTLESLGETMKYAGPVAAAAGFSLEEVAAAAGLLGDAGIQGSMAGTVLRGVMLRLVNPPKQAAEALSALGVSITDSSGKIKPLAQIVKELEEATKDMTDAQRTAIISQIAGQNAASGLLAIMDAGGDTLAAFTKELENAGGTAERIANQQIDNLAGDIEMLKSALEFTGIMIYQGFDKPLRSVTQTITGYVERIGNAIEAHDSLADGLAATSDIIGEMLADALGALTEFTPKILDMARKLIMSFIASLEEWRPFIATAAVDIMTTFINAILEIVPEFLEVGMLFLRTLGKGIAGQLPALIETAKQSIEYIILTITEFLPDILEIGVQIIKVLIEGITSYIPVLIELGLGLLIYLIEAILENIPIVIDTAVTIMESLVNGLTDALPLLIDLGLTIVQMLMGSIIDNAERLIDAAITIVDTLITFIADNLDMIIDFAIEIVMAIITGLVNNLDKLIDAALRLVDALITGLLNNIDLLIEAALKLVMAVSMALIDNIELVINAAIKLVLGIVEGLIRSIPELVNAAIKLVLGIIDGLLQALPQLVATGVTLIMNLIGAMLRLLPQILSLGIQLVGELAIGIIKAIPRALSAVASLGKSIWEGLKSAFKGIGQIGSDLVKGLWNGISDVTGWILNKIKGFGQSVMKAIKKIFGIASPSKIMRDEIGKNLTLGIGVGLEEGMPELQRDMDKELGKLTSKMKAAVEFESASIGTKIVAGNGKGVGERVVETINDNSDNSTVITGNTFIIRQESDIEKVAQELDRLRRRRGRGLGVAPT